MKAKIKFYPHGMSKGDQFKLLGTDAAKGWDRLFVMFSLIGAGIGTGISIQAALDMGLTEADLKASVEAPQEFDVKLQKGG